MNLTNKQPNSRDQSVSFSNYISHGEKTGGFPCQVSWKSETQLLDSSPIHQNSSFCISSEESIQRPFVLKADSENSQFSDLGTEFLIGGSCKNKKEKTNSQNNEASLEKISQYLVKVISSFEGKFQKADEKEVHQKLKFSESSTNMCQGSILESILRTSSTSTIKKETQAHCCNQSGNYMQVLLQLIQKRGQIKLVQEQSQKYRREFMQLQLAYEQQRMTLKKSSTECLKLKQLLKQYRAYFKKKNNVQQNHQSNRDLDNSLDKKLKLSGQDHHQFSKKLTTNEVPLFDSFQTIFDKETPKTPQHFRYHSCQNLLNLQKTKVRSNDRLPSNALKNIIQFSSKAQKQDNKRKQLLKTLESKEEALGKLKNCNDRFFYQKYPLNELLELDNASLESDIQDIFKLDHFSTMESLPEISAVLSDKQTGKHLQINQRGTQKYRRLAHMQNV